MAINIKTQTQVTMTITGSGYEDIRNQAEEYFGFVVPQVQEVNSQKGYQLTKSRLIRALNVFDKKFFGIYNNDTGRVDQNIGLIDLKKFVETELGEPQVDIPIG